MSKPRQGAQLVPLVRGSFLRALNSLDLKGQKRGSGLTELIRREMQSKPLETMKVMSQWVPKEMLVETVASEDLTSYLREVANAVERIEANQAMEEKRQLEQAKTTPAVPSETAQEAPQEPKPSNPIPTPRVEH